MPAKTRATQMLHFMSDAVRSRLHRQTGGVFYRDGVLLVEDDALDLEEIEEAVEVTEESGGVKESPREKTLRKSGNVSILQGVMLGPGGRGVCGVSCRGLGLPC